CGTNIEQVYQKLVLAFKNAQ
ncbi:HIT domain-containing protein, partial [Campylobacter jejuni]|nr:HIT domain-containing protein [Campylobacter jejuni]